MLHFVEIKIMINKAKPQYTNTLPIFFTPKPLLPRFDEPRRRQQSIFRSSNLKP
ncbi:hypothetical protein [Burkholderia multivorans]|uniref:hypothetical protein n=1 Tax=Burkholderia multivorans TaxID=87883 RepID=UPI001C245A83|nr:hypothetical protein [Burkholderia multivorans]MBU9223684.1 hypothetical protein [Burkholderia multivorans]MBU9417418.1 hypothetical protein [Burkholderia multivorans]MBU9475268.1 hypothetical protein [Burkholderia multivorans]